MFVGYLEKVDPRLFVSNGTTDGIVTLATTSGFKTNQQVIITAVGESTLHLVVKFVASDTQVVLGPNDNNASSRTDLSAYTVIKTSAIRANAQNRFSISPTTIQRAVYEEEPTVAIREVIVDEFGRKITSTKSGSKLGLDVNILNPAGTTGDPVDECSQIAAVLNNVNYVSILDYNIPAGKKFYLQKINISCSSPAAEAEVVFISGGSTIVRHYVLNMNMPNVFDELPKEREFIGGAGVILRVQARVAGNVHPNANSTGWASINGYSI